MRISHRYKFVFISKPRCASTTLRMILNPYSDILSDSKPPYHHHSTALELKIHFDLMGWNWEDYYVFTTVRNPWEMMVSYYSFFKPDINFLYKFDKFEKQRGDKQYQPDNLSSFNDWVRNGRTYHRLKYVDGELKTNLWVDGFSKMTLENYTQDVDGSSLVDLIIPVEHLGDLINGVLGKLGIDYSYDGKRASNQSNHRPYQDYYDEQSKKIIEMEFASDIEFGKYKF